MRYAQDVAARTCTECTEEVRYAKGIPGVLGWDASGWVHVSTGTRYSGDGTAKLANHAAQPNPMCPKCGSGTWGAEDTPWGIQWRCGECRHEEYYSLGD